MTSRLLSFPAISSPSFKPCLKPSVTILDRHTQKINQRKSRNGICRAELSGDASVGVAIGACILNSLVFPTPPSPEDDDSGDSVIDSSDARFAVMGIISFIPYFNWLSWIFAWMDTGKKRYAVYAIVYLAPYLRPNLSISPEDSWLPIASILLCILHIQLEASIRNGDIQGLQMFSEIGDRLTPNSKRKENRFTRKEKKSLNDDPMKLPTSHEKSGNFIRDWGVPRRPFEDSKREKMEDEEVDDGKKH